MSLDLSKTVMAYITTKDKAQACHIGRVLVEKKLVACANVIDGMQSLYWWEGKVQESQEAILIVKTVNEKVDDTIRIVKALHSYEVPCIVTFEISQGNPDYLNWIQSVVGAAI